MSSTGKALRALLLYANVLDKLVLYGIEYEKKVFTSDQFAERVIDALKDYQDAVQNIDKDHA